MPGARPRSASAEALLRSPVRLLGDADAAELLELCDRDPVANVFVAGRVSTVGCEPRRLGGEVWGYVQRGELVSACWAGANLVPVEATDDALDQFAARARRQGRRCSSLVGPAHAVLGLWDRLADSWAPARDVRPDQQLMVIDSDPLVPPDPGVRRTSRDDLDVLVPACVEMFTEEVGYSPVASDGGRLYRRRVEELVTTRRSFARIDGCQVVFKAELGAVSSGVAQVQGVWVPPALRSRGLAAPGMAAVVAMTRREVDVVSLYVNSYNARAVAAYERAGFRRVGTFATVLF